MPRFYCPVALESGQSLDLPASAARHVQVLRLQPGDPVTLFTGGLETGAVIGGEFEATITHMGRSDVQVQIGAHHALEREASVAVHLAVGMPSNERMDWLVEKAAELGVASIQPLTMQRSVLKLSGERADKKRLHWQSIAIAACEQCGRNRVPVIHDVMSLTQWLACAPPARRYVLSLAAGTQPLSRAMAPGQPDPVLFLSGPEGGFSSEEEASALAVGFVPVTLGPRTLRAETAPLVALTALTLPS